MPTENQIKNTFRKAERLHSRKLIDTLFAQGKHVKASCLRCVYCYSDEKLESQVQVMFSVPKKKFKKAVTRNLIKRRMREAYRLNKSDLNKAIDENDKNLMIAFLYANDKVENFETISSALKEILTRLSRTPENS